MSATKMNAQEIIKFIADAKKKTPVKVPLMENCTVRFLGLL